MTHELSRGWDQPDRQAILIDETYAVMRRRDFNALADYSHSRPSAVYEGKMWKSQEFETRQITEGDRKGMLYQFPTGNWLIRWWSAAADPNMCKLNTRVILIIETEIKK